MKLEIVDVFAEEALAGNPLAVVRDVTGLSDERMQAMALEMNFSETTFVLSEADDRARVRIFTPTQELPFAGHPTLGTAWVLGRNQKRFTLELDAGDVAVDFEEGIAWMSPPTTELHDTYAVSDVASWLGLRSTDLDAELPPQRGSVGPDFLFVALDGIDFLRRLEPTLEQLRALPAFGLFAFSARGYPDGGDYAARMFFEAGGLREDPATGSANSVFAAYLMQTRGDDFSAVVDQGVEMNRPSRIYLEARQGAIRVGGKVQSVAAGHWTFDR
jgi:trans-2,3-dihydro-3-hydroxyanthranilate isomerase